MAKLISGIFCLLSENESMLIKSPVCLSVCQHLNRFADFHEMWYAGNTIEGDLDAISSNPISSAI
jgi:hypothetical protein